MNHRLNQQVSYYTTVCWLKPQVRTGSGVDQSVPKKKISRYELACEPRDFLIDFGLTISCFQLDTTIDVYLINPECKEGSDLTECDIELRVTPIAPAVRFFRV